MDKGGRKRADNQNNSAAVKKVKTDDEKVERNEDQDKIVMHPLLMTEVLPRVLNYLNTKTLKKSRLVCSMWRSEGGKILLKRTNIQLKYFETGDIKGKKNWLEKFLKTTSPSATFSVVIDWIKSNSDPNNLKNVLPLLLQKTTALSYRQYYSLNREHVQMFAQCLKFFPNLQTLHLFNDNRCSCSMAEEKTLFWTKLESLKEIRLLEPIRYVRQMNDSFTNTLLSNGALAVNEINLSVAHHIPNLERLLNSGFNWPIKKLVLELGKLQLGDLATVRAFLDKISWGLKHLEWTIVYKDLPDEYEFRSPWTENSIMPLTLNKLETMKIIVGCQFARDSDWTWALFTCALQLPNLKTLVMNKVPGHLEERIKEWNEDPNAAGRTLRSESLANLKIMQVLSGPYSVVYEIPDESSVILSKRLWPNLKILSVQKPPQNFPASFFLSEWINLERLDLKFVTRPMDKNVVNLWKKWLTGRGSKTLNEVDAFSLKDLKNLKHLRISEHANLKEPHIVTNFLAENSLKQMTQLQSLHLQNSVMSRPVKEMLKRDLGPNVHILIK